MQDHICFLCFWSWSWSWWWTVELRKCYKIKVLAQIERKKALNTVFLNHEVLCQSKKLVHLRNFNASCVRYILSGILGIWQRILSGWRWKVVLRTSIWNFGVGVLPFIVHFVWKNESEKVLLVWNEMFVMFWDTEGKRFWVIFLCELSVVRMAHRETSVFGGHLSKPSDVLGSMKRSLGRKPKCQCKHHQQKLLQKQEEQRKQLQAKLVEKGFKRAINTTYNKPYNGMKYWNISLKCLHFNCHSWN